MEFTIEKFIEILKDPKCIEFDGEVEGCKVAFYRERHLGNKQSYYTVREGLSTISNFPRKKDITERTSAGTNWIPTKLEDCKIKIKGRKITVIPNKK